MSEDLEMRARRVAEKLADHAEFRSAYLSRNHENNMSELRDAAADALAELAEIVRALVAEVSTQ